MKISGDIFLGPFLNTFNASAWSVILRRRMPITTRDLNGKEKGSLSTPLNTTWMVHYKG